MGFLAGETLTAGKLNRIQPTPYEEACTASLTVTTATYADITGASITLTTQADNAIYMAEAVFDCNVTGTSTTSLMVGRLLVNGVADSGISVYAMDTLDRSTIAMRWRGTLAATGSHTLKLQGANSGAAGTGVFQQDDTKLQVTIYEVV
jgi:hypothetical protein